MTIHIAVADLVSEEKAFGGFSLDVSATFMPI